MSHTMIRYHPFGEPKDVLRIEKKNNSRLAPDDVLVVATAAIDFIGGTDGEELARCTMLKGTVLSIG